MCRIPKVILVAPADHHAGLRKALSSLEYDIVAAVASVEEVHAIGADVAVLWEPAAGDLRRLAELSLKTVALGGAGDGADMALEPDDAASFKTRVWELFRPGAS